MLSTRRAEIFRRLSFITSLSLRGLLTFNADRTELVQIQGEPREGVGEVREVRLDPQIKQLTT